MRRILPAGQDALLVETGDLCHALGLYHALNAAMEDAVSATASAGESVVSPAPTRQFAAVTELVPAAQTVLVRFDPRKIRAASLAEAIMMLPDTPDEAQEHRTVTVPVIYDGEDLETVAQLLGISADEVVARHTGTPWTAAFGGFAPGFTYLVDGDPIFDVPRRTTPRLVVPSGAVGLAGRFSGVYPRESSGGWQLIGYTAMPMWDVHADPPAAIMPGDRVTFHAERDQAIMTDIAQQRRTPTDRDIRAHAGNSGSGSESTTCDHGLRADRPGLLALFEDEGRHASAMGVAGSGACDMPAYRLANMLVGNPPDAPAIELTVGDAAFTAIGNVVVAVTGAPVDLCITGKAASGADPGRTTIRQSLHRQEAIILHDGENPDHWRAARRLAGLSRHSRRVQSPDDARQRFAGHHVRHRTGPTGRRRHAHRRNPRSVTKRRAAMRMERASAHRHHAPCRSAGDRRRRSSSLARCHPRPA